MCLCTEASSIHCSFYGSFYVLVFLCRVCFISRRLRGFYGRYRSYLGVLAFWKTNISLHAVCVYGLAHCHHELFFIVSGICAFYVVFYCMLSKGKTQTCHFADDNIGLFVLLGEEGGKENNRCEDQNILNWLGGNTVSISSQRAVLTLP